ncbi:hypothetical protein MMC18_008648 [Xylographa bjoerkii]|nr:hypothetical protein [Xylographa bjoerkii]
MPGIAELYVGSVARQIKKHLADGTEQKIKRAEIEWTLLEALNGSDLAFEYKIAFYAAILKAKKFDIFWLGQKALYGLSENSVLPFVPDSSLEEFNNPSLTTVSSRAGSDDADIIALNLSAEPSPNTLEIAKPGDRRKLLVNERRVSFDLALEDSDNLENAYNDYNFEDHPQFKIQDENTGNVRASPNPTYTRRRANHRQSTGNRGVGRKGNVAKTPRTQQKTAREATTDNKRGGIATSVATDKFKNLTGEFYRIAKVAGNTRAKKVAVVAGAHPAVRRGVDWQSLSVEAAPASEPLNSTPDDSQLCYDADRSFGDGADVDDMTTGVSDAELVGEDVNIAANAAAYQGFSGGEFL